jgi:hypothetical protein
MIHIAAIPVPITRLVPVNSELLLAIAPNRVYTFLEDCFPFSSTQTLLFLDSRGSARLETLERVPVGKETIWVR